jgi:hypothetical protein
VKDSYKKKLLSFASKMGLEVLTGRYVSGNSYNCSSFASISGVLIISVYRYMRAYPILSYPIISYLSYLFSVWMQALECRCWRGGCASACGIPGA